MIRIAICDDDINFLHFLHTYLQNNLHLQICVNSYVNPYDLLDNIHNIDVLFLDYELPHLDGIKILDKIKDFPVIKIMVSNYSYISFDTYQYKLFWFVRKQNIDYDLSMLLPHLREELIYNKIKKFQILSLNKYLTLEFKNINYIETQSNYLIIHTNKKSYQIRSSFKSILDQFDKLSFVIPVYGVIINVEYVEFIDFHHSTIHLKNGVIFSISRSKKRGVIETYAKYNHHY